MIVLNYSESIAFEREPFQCTTIALKAVEMLLAGKRVRYFH